MFEKSKREGELVELLRGAKPLRSQAEVVRLMQARGLRVTQASISRDFRRLGVVKVGGNYLLPGEHGRVNGRQELAVSAALIQETKAAGPHLLVLKTPPGAASVVAASIDRLRAAEVVGTIAGDDTVFVATPNRAAQVAVERLLKDLP